MPALMVKMDGIVRTFPLPEGMPVFIGRARECDIHLTRSGVSRRHAVIVYRDGVCGIQDLGSFNGTHVNGAKLDHSAALHDGDVIRLSGYTLTYINSGERARAQTKGALPEVEPGATGSNTERYEERPSSTLRLPRAMTQDPSVQHLFTHVKQTMSPRDGETTRIFAPIEPPRRKGPEGGGTESADSP